MITYLSGFISETITRSGRSDLGFMMQPRIGNRKSHLVATPFAADNGCFRECVSDAEWIHWLGTLEPYRKNLLFVVAPDVVGDAEATSTRSLPYLEYLKDRGYPTAFVSQDGATSASVPWTLADVLFVGGSTAWKLSDESFKLVGEAQDRGLRTHMGRVNSFKRMKVAADHGIDTVDGTFLAWGPDVNWPRLVRWLDCLNQGACTGRLHYKDETSDDLPGDGVARERIVRLF
jgi:hypothetical protein